MDGGVYGGESRRGCMRGVPRVTLLATILCFAGVALFCGAGHEALSGTAWLLQNHWNLSEDTSLIIYQLIDIFLIVIYGTAGAFFLYGILLFTEGVLISRPRKSYSVSTACCGRCISVWFIILTYFLTIVWLGVFGFSTLPVLIGYNIRDACNIIPLGNPTSVCMDLRQYGLIPWNHTGGRLCDETLTSMCDTSEFNMAFNLYISACAGATVSVIAMLIYCTVLVYNYGMSQLLRRDDYCTKL
uniref:neuronal membrane glycoprotein M6-b-like isoform X2 n=1 Tax=Myxine glutinosa TaxID=7769 RepID=UPI00358E325B